MPTVDKLITELISSGRQASTEELAVIIAHAAKAPFATYWSRVPIELRELLAQHGIVVPTRLPSLQRHLLKRIYGEEQWPVGTTAEQYIADLHQAVTHPVVQIWTYRYLAQSFAGFLAPSHVQGGVRPERYIFVAYNPTYKTLTTGYQASDVQSILPQNIRIWCDINEVNMVLTQTEGLEKYTTDWIEMFLRNYKVLVGDAAELAEAWAEMDEREQIDHRSIAMQIWGMRVTLGELYRAGRLNAEQVMQLACLDRALLEEAHNIEVAYGPALPALMERLLTWGTPLTEDGGTVRLEVPVRTLPVLAQALASMA